MEMGSGLESRPPTYKLGDYNSRTSYDLSVGKKDDVFERTWSADATELGAGSNTSAVASPSLVDVELTEGQQAAGV